MAKDKKEDDNQEPWEKLAKCFFSVEAFEKTFYGDEAEGRATRGAIVAALTGIIETETAQLPRSEAIAYLGYMEDESAVTILCQTLTGESALERKASALSLARLAPQLLNQMATVLRVLETAAMDPVAYVREAAIFSRKYIVHYGTQIAEQRATDGKSESPSGDGPKK